MRRILKTLLITTAVTFALPASSAEHATADEAIAMCQKVIGYIKTNGKDKAIAEVNSQKQFIDRDLYVSIGDAHGLSLANGGNPKLAGKNLLEMKDVDGKSFVREGTEILRTKPSGWVDYKFPNPVTKQIEQKSMYFEKTGDLVVSCGIYKG